MHRHLRIFPLFLLASCALAAISSADIIEDRFKAYDKNGDGVLSGDELDAAPWLRRLDLNHDGKVTLEEAREAFKLLRDIFTPKPEHGPRTADVFKLLDRNGDGKLTPDELPNPEWFSKLDIHHHGSVTLADAVEAMGEFLPKKFAGRKFGAFRPSGSPPVQPPPSDASVTEAPQLLKASSLGVGRMQPDFTWKNLQGQDVKLSSVAGGKPLVIGCFSPSCPISGKLGPEMARLEKDYADRGVAFAWLNVDADAKAGDLQTFVTTHALHSLVANDPGGATALALQAASTTEVFVLDAKRTLTYRGAINDQYGLGYSLNAPRHTYLRDALDAVLRGQPPAIAATTAPGCALDLPKDKTPALTSTVTYHRDIARIMNQNCVECHRSGGIGPFTLTSYADLIEHAGMIRKQIDRSVMPPWFADASESGAHALFSNDRSLSEKDHADLLAWLSSKDRPQGDPADAPAPRHFSEEWTIGKPDLILQIPRPIAVKAEGVMPYQYAVIDTGLTEDKWIQGYEILPTARQVVHHVIVRMREGNDRTQRRDEGLDGYWAAYVPGNSYRILPEGFAKKLPAGAKLQFQLHYTPNGKATEDQTRIGIIFAKHPPQYEVHVAALANPRIYIPAGEAHHVETLEQRIPVNTMATAFFPHMHFRGKSFKYELTVPGGQTETLLDVPRYDFNWQIGYILAKPKFIPAGSLVKLTAVYDNSAQNPANPDPTRNVRWGQQTSDEMMIGYVEHYVPVSASVAAAK